MFTHGNVLVLESTATNKTLRIRDGVVEGTGGRGQLAQFTVHVRRPGVVALQNIKNPDQYLAIYEGATIGNVRPFCSVQIWTFGYNNIGNVRPCYLLHVQKRYLLSLKSLFDPETVLSLIYLR